MEEEEDDDGDCCCVGLIDTCVLLCVCVCVCVFGWCSFWFWAFVFSLQFFSIAAADLIFHVFCAAAGCLGSS